MNKEYFDHLIKNLLKLPIEKFETDLSSYNKKCTRAECRLFSLTKITIKDEQKELIVTIVSQSKVISSTFTYPFQMAIFSSHWRKWRKLAKKLEREQTERKKKEELEAKNKNTMEMEQLLMEIFPDIYERDLLGDDDDK